ncbi:Starch-binding associating with outer membrane [Cnuella takakiae]|uniref:Starch-binding associating with outer membrane n=1 Tax=Cnuella takakiae TaxID=1302690 RepID=A0A1M4Z0M5_9BACT|nr:RagB/SusD family nutrient uptake outer membrane protein [Cnuella takakiae]OLY94374.1 RagB/SusD family nutrient uptake outer membrane protein [Cnuella takakiae]SHF11302.1 Starch-binding associating with outer membrane [Cnuella takakiae]
MKHTHKIIAALFAAAALAASPSCTKLKDTPYTSIVSNQLNVNSETIAALQGAAYSNWRFVMLDWDGLWRAQELSADQEVIPGRPNGWVDGGVYRRIHEHRWTADEGIVVNTWNRTFAGITNCNRLIYQIESGLIPLTTNKEAVLAELKVLRASYYYILCDIFGNVPIVTQFDLPAGFLPAQSTRKQVYEFVVKELTENIPLLSEKNDVTTYGKFNKWAGYTLLAKMYLNAEVYAGTPEWEKCIAACDAVINSSGGYRLEPDQKNVFRTQNQSSRELIFALPLDEDFTNNWNAFDLHMQSLSPENQKTYNLLSSPWGGMSAIPQFISSYDPADLRFQRNWIRGQQFSASGEQLVVELGAFKGKPLNYLNEVPSIASAESVHGYRLGKFEIAQGANVQLSNDFPVFRYADVLLMKAESLLRTGRENDAATIVTQVRTRAFPNDPQKATVTGAQLKGGSSYDYGRRDINRTTNEGGGDILYGRFLDELAWEFDQEGRRRQDMIRFGAFTRKSWLSHDATNDPNKIIFPLPRPELAKNQNLKQNPGY